MIPYRVMYRLGLAPWERRPMPAVFREIVEGPGRLPPGRALDVGCGTGEDAVYLATHGWQVTGVDNVDRALATARRRAAERGAEVRWIAADVACLGALGVEPGYTLLQDMGCIQGLPDRARMGAAAGLAALAAPGATLLLLAFRRGRRLVLPRGMDRGDVLDLLGGSWDLVDAQSMVDPSMPPPIRRARPTLYRLVRRDDAAATTA